MQNSSEAPQLSCLFITYNRSDLLKVAFEALRTALDGSDMTVEYVISDDHSSAEHLAVIRGLTADQLLIAPQNRGLGNNQNKGLAACRAPFVLHVQDDWEFVATVDQIRSAMEILKADSEVGAVNFLRPGEAMPHETRLLPGGITYDVFANDGIDAIRASGARPYSDRPHLKHQAFVREVGRYAEGMPLHRMELDFQRQVACQSRWHIAHLHGRDAFINHGELRTLNPGQLRARRIARMEAIPLFGPLYKALRSQAKKWLQR